MKIYAASFYTHAEVIDRMRAECETREIDWSGLIFQVFGERYAKHDLEFRKWFRIVQREEEIRDEVKRARKKNQDKIK